MRPGDWIEMRDAPNTRGIITAASRTGIAMRLSGDGNGTRHTVDRAEADDLWELMRFDGGAAIPWWCAKGEVFLPRTPSSFVLCVDPKIKKTMATVVDVRPGWVAYVDRCGKRTVVFLIAQWWSFQKDWTPRKPPSAWARIMRDD